jgi:hypothetical protein
MVDPLSYRRRGLPRWRFSSWNAQKRNSFRGGLHGLKDYMDENIGFFLIHVIL